jgi:hypothetical protein
LYWQIDRGGPEARVNSAGMLMMLESTISLVTIVVIASRAINILGN